VEEGDRNRLGALPARFRSRRPYLVLVERDEDLTLVGHALGDLEPETPRHERLRLLVQQVVEVGPVGLLDLEHVSKTARRDQGGRRAGPFGQGVDDHGRAVSEKRDTRQLRLAEHIHHPVLEAGGCGRALGQADSARLLVQVHEIREGSADVDSRSHR
jgi:hypothetical protein